MHLSAFVSSLCIIYYGVVTSWQTFGSSLPHGKATNLTPCWYYMLSVQLCGPSTISHQPSKVSDTAVAAPTIVLSTSQSGEVRRELSKHCHLGQGGRLVLAWQGEEGNLYGQNKPNIGKGK